MRRRHVASLTALTAVMTLLPLMLVSPAGARTVRARPSASGERTSLPLSGYSHMVVDDANKHLFVSGGASDTSIVVLNFKGKIIATIDDLPGAEAMAIDRAGGKLYVAECGGAAIQTIHTKTLSRGGSFALDAGTCPGSMAWLGSRLWFDTGNGLASLEPSTGIFSKYGGANFPELPLLTAAGRDGTHVFGATAVASPTKLYEYSIDQSGTPTLLKRIKGPANAQLTHDIVVDDGDEMGFLASAAPTSIVRFSVPDMGIDKVGLMGGPSNSVATTSRDILAGGISDGNADDDILMFEAGTTDHFNRFSTKASGDPWLADRGLALASDGSELFAVASASEGLGPYDVFAFPDPVHAPTDLTFDADPPVILHGQSTTLTGVLSYPNGGQVDGGSVGLSRTNPDGSTTDLGVMQVDHDGNFGRIDTPPQPGKNTYRATYQGDFTHRGSTASALVTVIGNGRIVFDSNRTGNNEIFVMNADGTGVKQLTNNTAGDFDPVWSPDGSKIAFTSDRSGNEDLWVMKADGSQPTRLTTDSHFDGNPSWSPDGSQIAFDSDRSGNLDIWTIDLQSGAVHKRTAAPGVDELPSWSPDGTKIAFDSDRSGDFDVLTMNADGSHVAFVTDDTGNNEGGASWSPDGTKVAYGSDQTGDVEIFATELESGDVFQLTHGTGFDGDQCYSADGSLIAYASTRAGKTHIWVMNADGSNPTQLTNSGSLEDFPDWDASR